MEDTRRSALKYLYSPASTQNNVRTSVAQETQYALGMLIVFLSTYVEKKR